MEMLIVSKTTPYACLKFNAFPFYQEWPHDFYPPWAHGPGYVISRDIAKFIVHGHEQRTLKVRISSFKLSFKDHSTICVNFKIHLNIEILKSILYSSFNPISKNIC